MKKIIAFGVVLSVLLLAAGLRAQSQAPKLRVYISVDMEGITGVVAWEQTMSGNPDYETARKWMAADVNAAIEGALKAGAAEIVVNDAHGDQRNLIPDDLNPKAVLISGAPKPLGMMEGISGDFDACIFIGYHAMAGTEQGVLDHTQSGSGVYAVKVNGLELPELGLNAAVAGVYGVPVVFVSGDVAVCKQAKAVLGNDVLTAPVKDGAGRYAARLVPAVDARRAIRDRVAEALKKVKQFKPYRVPAPFRFELDFANSGQADLAVLIPQVKRESGRNVSFPADDFIQGFKLLRGLIALGSLGLH